MTIEEKEAIEELKILKEDYREDDGYGYATAECQKTITALDMAIEALEQEPCDDNWRFYYNHGYAQAKRDLSCEDCISRQAVDELSKELVHTTKDKADFLCNFWEGLQKLPSVTPKEKTAAWVGIDQEPHEVCECNACGWLLYEEDTKDFRFCPSCGAKMEVADADSN